MLTVRRLPEEPVEEPQVLAIGTFDGLHRGHQALLEETVSDARNRSLPASILTFEPDPVTVLQDIPRTDYRLLTREDKMTILNKLGFELVYEVNFDADFSSISPRTFIKSLVLNRLRASSVHVGYDFKFGRDREGDTTLLKKMLDAEGVNLTVKDPVEVDGRAISSMIIRKLIRRGKMKDARDLLGRPYIVRETVQSGEGRGRSLGFPTLNFPLQSTIHPERGVYTVWLEVGAMYRAVANFGRHPTVGVSPDPLLEVHVLDSPPSLDAGDVAHVHFGSFLREERDFDSIDRLKEQLHKDVRTAESVHDTMKEPNPISSFKSVSTRYPSREM